MSRPLPDIPVITLSGLRREKMKRLLLEAFTEGFNLGVIVGDSERAKEAYCKGAKAMLSRLLPPRRGDHE